MNIYIARPLKGDREPFELQLPPNYKETNRQNGEWQKRYHEWQTQQQRKQVFKRHCLTSAITAIVVMAICLLIIN